MEFFIKDAIDPCISETPIAADDKGQAAIIALERLGYELESGDPSQPSRTIEVEEEIIQEIRKRRQTGRSKYNKTMERTDLGTLQWAQHALEESLDHSVYLKKFMREHKYRLASIRALLEDLRDIIKDRTDRDDPTPNICNEVNTMIRSIDDELYGKKEES